MAYLDISDNQISNLSALANLTNLSTLDAGNNYVTDLAPLSTLVALTDLELYGNSVTDVTPLAGMTNLCILNLFRNNIGSISALITNAATGGLGSGDLLIIKANPLDDPSQVQILRTVYGITVNY